MYDGGLSAHPGHVIIPAELFRSNLSNQLVWQKRISKCSARLAGAAQGGTPTNTLAFPCTRGSRGGVSVMCQRNMLVVEHREQVVGSQFFVLRPLLPSFPFLLQFVL